jgi:hypothetical protein
MKGAVPGNWHVGGPGPGDLALPGVDDRFAGMFADEPVVLVNLNSPCRLFATPIECPWRGFWTFVQ